MGASAWYEIGGYAADAGEALLEAQTKTLRGRGYDVDSPAELWADEQWVESVGAGGTGTVLDLREIIGEDEADRFATLRPMPAAEFSRLLGVKYPAYNIFLDGYLDGRLPQPESRGSARSAVLYRDGEPSEIVYWGLTAD